MGYRCIAYTPWMADILERDYGLESRWFECGTDTDTYGSAATEERVPGRIAVYARRETERRAVDLALAGLARCRAPPGRRGRPVRLQRREPASPVPARNLGVRPPSDLAALYRTASAGIVFSLTTHSLVAHEMMASGLPLVELEGDNVASALGRVGRPGDARRAAAGRDRRRARADPRPARRGRAMARRARAFVEERTWERAGDQVESALFEFLAQPRAARALQRT